MSDDFELIETSEVPSNGLQVYQQDKAMVDLQIATAKRYPRNLTKAIQNSITIVTMDQEVAESCTYTLKKGGKVIAGPSVNLAKIVAQQMGNMRIENRVVGYDQTHVTCEATCFDLERNFAIRTQIKKSIVGSTGRYTEDMCTITGNAANAIALRNAIFAVVDASIIKKVYDSAKKMITGDLSDAVKLIARRTSIVNGFKQMYQSYGLTDEEIAGSVGRKLVDHITSDDIVALIGYEKALKETEISFESIFRPMTAVQSRITKPEIKDKSGERLLALIKICKKRSDLEKLEKECATTEEKIAYDEAYAKLK
jgi:hypothetical protein